MQKKVAENCRKVSERRFLVLLLLSANSERVGASRMPPVFSNVLHCSSLNIFYISANIAKCLWKNLKVDMIKEGFRQLFFWNLSFLFCCFTLLPFVTILWMYFHLMYLCSYVVIKIWELNYKAMVEISYSALPRHVDINAFTILNQFTKTKLPCMPQLFQQYLTDPV